MHLRNTIIASLFILNSGFAFTQQSFTEQIKMQCNDSVIRDHLGYPTWNPATLFKKPHYGYAEIREDSSFRQILYYRPPIYFHGKDTLMVLCAKATQITCDTGIYLIDVDCNERVDSFIIINTACEVIDTFKIAYQSEAEIAEKHIHGQATMLFGPEKDIILYQSEVGFKGQDYILLYLNQLKQHWLLIYNVACKDIIDTKNIFTENNEHKTILVSNNLLSLEALNFRGTDLEISLTDLNGNQFKVEKDYQSGSRNIKLNLLQNGFYFLSYKSGKHINRQGFILLR